MEQRCSQTNSYRETPTNEIHAHKDVILLFLNSVIKVRYLLHEFQVIQCHSLGRYIFKDLICEIFFGRSLPEADWWLLASFPPSDLQICWLMDLSIHELLYITNLSHLIEPPRAAPIWIGSLFMRHCKTNLVIINVM